MEKEIPPIPTAEAGAEAHDAGRLRMLGRRLLNVFRRSHEDQASTNLPDMEAEELDLNNTPPEVTLGPESPTTIIRYTMGTKELRYLNSRGEEIGPPTRYQSLDTATKVFDTLTTLLLSPSQRSEYTSKEAGEATGQTTASMTLIFKRLGEQSPPGTVSFDHESRTIKLDDISLANQVLTPSQRSNIASNQELKQSKLQRSLEELQERDTRKENLLEQDHALITTEEHTFIIPFESAHAIIAARTIEAISQFPGELISHMDLAKAAWQNMSLEERRFFAEGHKESIIDTEGWPIRASVLETLRNLTNSMGITREPHDFTFRKLITNLTFTPEEGPPSPDIMTDPHTALVFPPGTRRSYIKEEYGKGEVTSTTLEIARHLISLIGSDSLNYIPQEDGLDYLDFITSSEGKYAIRDTLIARNSRKDPNKVIRTIKRGVIRPILGSGYGSALRNRTIAGNHATGYGHRARQTGGALPTTTKWHVGIKYNDVERSPRLNGYDLDQES